MSKKELLIKIFQKLLPYRPVIEWFLPMLEDPVTTDTEIEEMFTIISSHIESLHDKKMKQTLQWIFYHIKNIQSKEAIDHVQELAEAEALLDQL